MLRNPAVLSVSLGAKRPTQFFRRKSNFRFAHSATASEATGNNSGARWKHYAGIGIFSSIVGGTACLGIWQTERYFWKVGLIEQRMKQLNEDPVPLPLDAVGSTKDVPTDEGDCHRVTVSGYFDEASTVTLGPRSAPPTAESEGAGKPPRPMSEKSGKFVYTLLRRPNGTPLIINRGWLPASQVEKWMSKPRSSGDLVHITGMVKTGEQKSSFSVKNDIIKRNFFWLDHASMAELMLSETDDLTAEDNSALPVLVDALDSDCDSSDNIQLLRKSKENFINFYMTPWKHATYAATWYSLAIFGTIMTIIRFRKNPRLSKSLKPRQQE